MMVYLASPYSHVDAAVRQRRYEAACAVTAAMLKRGVVVFSPIVHSHPLVAHGLSGEWDFWQPVDQVYLDASRALMVLQLPGWRESVGVQWEIEYARAAGKPVGFIPLARAEFQLLSRISQIEEKKKRTPLGPPLVKGGKSKGGKE